MKLGSIFRSIRRVPKNYWGFAFLVILFTVACFMLLAPWQLGKNTLTQRRNAQIEEATKTPAKPWQEVYSNPPTEKETYRSVSAKGTFGDQDVLVRLRSVDSSGAVIVLAPFTTNNGHTFLIDRGFVKNQGTEVPEFPPNPKGEVEITGRIYQNEPLLKHAAGNSLMVDKQLEVYEINSEQMSQLWKLNMESGYLNLVEGSPGVLIATPLPQLVSGPYLSYGLQWIAFGIIAPLGIGYLIYSEIKQRNLDRADEKEDRENRVNREKEENTGKKPEETEVEEETQPEPVVASVVPSRYKMKNLRDELKSAAGKETERSRSGKLVDRYGTK